MDTQNITSHQASFEEVNPEFTDVDDVRYQARNNFSFKESFVGLGNQVQGNGDSAEAVNSQRVRSFLNGSVLDAL